MSETAASRTERQLSVESRFLIRSCHNFPLLDSAFDLTSPIRNRILHLVLIRRTDDLVGCETRQLTLYKKFHDRPQGTLTQS
jgi:hypothetical protein